MSNCWFSSVKEGRENCDWRDLYSFFSSSKLLGISSVSFVMGRLGYGSI